MTLSQLTACGGGGGGGDESAASTEYVSFTGNANDTIIRDADNEAFSVLTQDRTVVIRSTKIDRLNGLTVNTDGHILSNGNRIGRIFNEKTADNTWVTLFYCDSGTRMNITLTDTWSHNCTQNTNPTPTPTPTPPSSNSTSDGINASTCLSLVEDPRYSYRPMSLYNSCNVKVYFSYCYQGWTGTPFDCNPNSTSGNFGEGTWQVSPRDYYYLPSYGNATGVNFYACAKGPSGIEPMPFITQISPKVFGICR